jgi:hypothetical protein
MSTDICNHAMGAYGEAVCTPQLRHHHHHHHNHHHHHHNNLFILTGPAGLLISAGVLSAVAV